MAAYDEGRLVVAGYRNNQLAVARISTDVPITSTPFDFNADSQADLAVFRPSDNTWYIQTAEGYSFRAWGQAGDEPAPADYDGDGKTDLAIFRPATGEWYVINSATQTFQVTNMGRGRRYTGCVRHERRRPRRSGPVPSVGQHVVHTVRERRIFSDTVRRCWRQTVAR